MTRFAMMELERDRRGAPAQWNPRLPLFFLFLFFFLFFFGSKKQMENSASAGRFLGEIILTPWMAHG